MNIYLVLIQRTISLLFALSLLVASDAADSSITYDVSSTLSEFPRVGENIVWFNLDESNLVLTEDGDFTPEILEMGKAMPLKSMRWPGGTVANYLDWRKTIGPHGQREPILLSTNWDNPGTKVMWGPDEAARYAEGMGGSLVICMDPNLGAEAAADFVEYMNHPWDGEDDLGAIDIYENPNGGVDWAHERAKNGHPAPYGITYWEYGNETGGKERIVWSNYQDSGDDAGNNVIDTDKKENYTGVGTGSRLYEKQRAVRSSGNLVDYYYSQRKALRTLDTGWVYNGVGEDWYYESSLLTVGGSEWQVESQWDGRDLDEGERAVLPSDTNSNGQIDANEATLGVHVDVNLSGVTDPGWYAVEIEGDPKDPVEWESFGPTDKVVLWSARTCRFAIGDGSKGALPALGSTVKLAYRRVREDTRRFQGRDFERFNFLFPPISSLSKVETEETWRVVDVSETGDVDLSSDHVAWAAVWSVFGFAVGDKIALYDGYDNELVFDDGTYGAAPQSGVGVSLFYNDGNWEADTIPEGDGIKRIVFSNVAVPRKARVRVQWTASESSAPDEPSSWSSYDGDDLQVLYNPEEGTLAFGDGSKGALPEVGTYIFLDYGVSDRDGYLQYSQAMKAVDPSVKLTSGASFVRNYVDQLGSYFDGSEFHYGAQYGGYDLASFKSGSSEKKSVYAEYVSKAYFSFPDKVRDKFQVNSNNGGILLANDGTILCLSENSMLDNGPAGRGAAVGDENALLWNGSTRFSLYGGLSQLLAFERHVHEFGEHTLHTVEVGGIEYERQYPMPIFHKTGFNNQTSSIQRVYEGTWGTSNRRLVQTGTGVAQSLLLKHFGNKLLADTYTNFATHPVQKKDRNGAAGGFEDVPKIVPLGSTDRDETVFFMGINTTENENKWIDFNVSGADIDYLDESIFEDAVMKSDLGAYSTNTFGNFLVESVSGSSIVTPVLNTYASPNRIRIETSDSPARFDYSSSAKKLWMRVDALTARVLKVYRDINDNNVKDVSETIGAFESSLSGSVVESDTDSSNLEDGTGVGAWGSVTSSGISISADGLDKAMLLDGDGVSMVSATADLLYDSLRHRTAVSFKTALRRDSGSSTILARASDDSILFELKLGGSERRLYHVESDGDKTFVDFSGVVTGAVDEIPHLNTDLFDAEAMATVTVYMGDQGYLVELETPGASGAWVSGLIGYRGSGTNLSALQVSASAGGGLWLDDVSVSQGDTTLVAPVLLAPAYLSDGSDNSFLVEWENRCPDARLFVVEKALSASGPFEEVSRTDSSYYADDDVAFGLKDYYRVRVMDSDGNLSPWSSLASVGYGGTPAVNVFSNNTLTGGDYLWGDSSNWNGGLPDYVDFSTVAYGDIVSVEAFVPSVEAVLLKNGGLMEVGSTGVLPIDRGANQYWNSGKLVLAPASSSLNLDTKLILNGGLIVADVLDLQLWSGFEGFGALEIESGSILHILEDLNFLQQDTDADGVLELAISGTGSEIDIRGQLNMATDNAVLKFVPSVGGEVSSIIVDGDVTLDGALTIDESQMSGEDYPDELVLIESLNGTISGSFVSTAFGSHFDAAEISGDGKMLLLKIAE